jgi:hypothetical protein
LKKQFSARKGKRKEDTNHNEKKISLFFGEKERERERERGLQFRKLFSQNTLSGISIP